MVSFTEEQIERYSRHILLPEVGGAGQRKLLGASVLVVGAGGLGSPVALYLAAAGIGTLGVVDADCVEMSNLQRQVLHTTADLGRPKCLSAQEALEAINPGITVQPYQTAAHLRERDRRPRGLRHRRGRDGHLPTRYLLNDACVFAGKPLVHAGILRFEGQVTTILPGEGPCYRCFYPEPPPPGLVPSPARRPGSWELPQESSDDPGDGGVEAGTRHRRTPGGEAAALRRGSRWRSGRSHSGGIPRAPSAARARLSTR